MTDQHTLTIACPPVLRAALLRAAAERVRRTGQHCSVSGLVREAIEKLLKTEPKEAQPCTDTQ